MLTLPGIFLWVNGVVAGPRRKVGRRNCAVNSLLSKELAQGGFIPPEHFNYQVPPWSCASWGNNAAMIGCQGFYEYQAGHLAGLDLNAYATRDISLG